MYICGVECENQEFDEKYKYCVFISDTWYIHIYLFISQ